jgi:hypothetical protein
MTGYKKIDNDGQNVVFVANDVSENVGVVPVAEVAAGESERNPKEKRYSNRGCAL